MKRAGTDVYKRQIFTHHRDRVLEEIEELKHHLEKIQWKIEYLKQAEKQC